MTTLIICGASGRMGQLVLEIAQETKKISKIISVDKHHPLENVIHDGNVLIDFTLPEPSLHHLKLAATYQKPIVIGTTGFSETQKKKIAEVAKSIPVVFSPNMSIGVNVLFGLIAKTTEILEKNFSINITETHHTKKIDSPSGTAKKMAEVVFEKIGITPKIDARREGDVIGTHTIVFTSPAEKLTLTHEATNRKVFAVGAIKAAEWITGKKPGLYTMAEVLELPL